MAVAGKAGRANCLHHEPRRRHTRDRTPRVPCGGSPRWPKGLSKTLLFLSYTSHLFERPAVCGARRCCLLTSNGASEGLRTCRPSGGTCPSAGPHPSHRSWELAVVPVLNVAVLRPCLQEVGLQVRDVGVTPASVFTGVLGSSFSRHLRVPVSGLPGQNPALWWGGWSHSSALGPSSCHPGGRDHLFILGGPGSEREDRSS